MYHVLVAQYVPYKKAYLLLVVTKYDNGTWACSSVVANKKYNKQTAATKGREMGGILVVVDICQP